MSEFILNKNGGKYDDLSKFAKAYIEAMFFTNCDTGDENENKANEPGTERLTRGAIAAIALDCGDFLDDNAATIAECVAAGKTLDSIAHDFWFTRQGHGCGFWEGKARGYPGDTWQKLDAYSKAQGEVYPYFNRGWIHYR
jgi:hypothetical protein